MTQDKISKRLVLDRLNWVDRMISDIHSLPLLNRDAFLANPHNIGAAESYLRRALEALFDIGRHILAKGFGEGVSEYKEIASSLKECNVMSDENAKLLHMLAGYRNRLVHFYQEVTPDELYQICKEELGDVERITNAYRTWLKSRPELIDDKL
jgi:uncharacterized protein YutE (UPF0331/DUF86 family)